MSTIFRSITCNALPHDVLVLHELRDGIVHRRLEGGGVDGDLNRTHVVAVQGGDVGHKGVLHPLMKAGDLLFFMAGLPPTELGPGTAMLTNGACGTRIGARIWPGWAGAMD